MKAVAAAPQSPKPEPVREQSWTCRCGCGTFFVDWAIFADHNGESRIRCTACDRLQCVTEPMLNGPH